MYTYIHTQPQLCLSAPSIVSYNFCLALRQRGWNTRHLKAPSNRTSLTPNLPTRARPQARTPYVNRTHRAAPPTRREARQNGALKGRSFPRKPIGAAVREGRGACRWMGIGAVTGRAGLALPGALRHRPAPQRKMVACLPSAPTRPMGARLPKPARRRDQLRPLPRWRWRCFGRAGAAAAPAPSGNANGGIARPLRAEEAGGGGSVPRGAVAFNAPSTRREAPRAGVGSV